MSAGLEVLFLKLFEKLQREVDGGKSSKPEGKKKKKKFNGGKITLHLLNLLQPQSNMKIISFHFISNVNKMLLQDHCDSKTTLES